MKADSETPREPAAPVAPVIPREGVESRVIEMTTVRLNRKVIPREGVERGRTEVRYVVIPQRP